MQTPAGEQVRASFATSSTMALCPPDSPGRAEGAAAVSCAARAPPPTDCVSSARGADAPNQELAAAAAESLGCCGGPRPRAPATGYRLPGIRPRRPAPAEMCTLSADAGLARAAAPGWMAS